MNIVKYLRKANIETTYDSKLKVFHFNTNGENKVLTKKEVEQYLFIRLVELIEEE